MYQLLVRLPHPLETSVLSRCWFSACSAQAVPDTSRIRRTVAPERLRSVCHSAPWGSARVLLGLFWKCSSPCQARGPKETGNWKPLVVGGLCGGSGVDACHVAEWWRDHRETQRGWSQDGLWLGRILQGHCTFRTISYIGRITDIF